MSRVLKLSFTAQRPGRFDFSSMSTIWRCSSMSAAPVVSDTMLG